MESLEPDQGPGTVAWKGLLAGQGFSNSLSVLDQ